MFNRIIINIWSACDIWWQTEELNWYPCLERCHVNYRHHFFSQQGVETENFLTQGTLDANFHSKHKKKKEQRVLKKEKKKKPRGKTSSLSHTIWVFFVSWFPWRWRLKTLGWVTITTYSKKKYRDAFCQQMSGEKNSLPLLFQYVHAVLSARALIWIDKAD